MTDLRASIKTGLLMDPDPGYIMRTSGMSEIGTLV